MEKKLILNAEVRTPEEKVKHLRKQRIIPGVVYGRKQEPISLKFDYSEFLKLYRISGESKIVSIALNGKNIDVLVYDVKKDPIKGDFQHIDFYAITKGEKVTTNIPLVFVGTSQASIDGAIIEEQMKEVEVKVLPKDLVDFIEVDLSPLENYGNSIRVSDLKIDLEKFELNANPEDVVVVAHKPVEEKIENEVATSDESDEGEDENKKEDENNEE